MASDLSHMAFNLRDTMTLCSLDAIRVLILLLELWGQVRGECEDPLAGSKLNLSVRYDLPSFEASTPIQNLVAFGGHVYVGAVNRIYSLTEDLQKVSEYKTGPIPAQPHCPPCQSCGDKINSSSSLAKDNTNMALLVETYYDDELFSCGSAHSGVCQRHILEDSLQDAEVNCMYSPKTNGGSTIAPTASPAPLGRGS
ncbi:hypothetical protein AAFF_G00029310 [Aldrovandia affinis]|uniref:Sema domain-containing protein n=1 Tax=Aldrovandia affinis TaxID=143900 RepID=A0AAD7S4D8_9TELE|nr:hypothetical protein AAFF_G00029310 [Aldrovandia affinis]